jgi:hypothetical protein
MSAIILKKPTPESALMDMSIVFVLTVFVIGLTSIGYILEEPTTASTKKKFAKSKD